MNLTTKERFMRHVQIGDDCWTWTGAGTRYGSFRIGRKMVPAHRVAWTLEHGAIPDGLHVLHRCDNPPCVNVAHLFLGTHTDNMHDMQTKKRHNPPIGERAKAAILNADQVVRIRDEYFSGRKSRMELAADFGLTHTGISHVLRRNSWNHLPPSEIEQNPNHIVDSAKTSAMIRNTRKSAGISQTELARAAEIDPSHLSKLESGNRHWSLKMFNQVKSAMKKLSA